MTDKYQLCNKDHPMPPGDQGRWWHHDAVETDYDGNYSKFQCPHCGGVFEQELPE